MKTRPDQKWKWILLTATMLLVLLLLIDWINYQRHSSKLAEVPALCPVGSNWDEVEKELALKGFVINEKILSSSDINNATSLIPRSIKQVKTDGVSLSATLLQLLRRESYYEIDLSVTYGEGPSRRRVIAVRKM